jgi:hypothetical protein
MQVKEILTHLKASKDSSLRSYKFNIESTKRNYASFLNILENAV